MKIKRATNSLAASKYLPIAVRMAAAIKSRVAGKKRVLDGVIVEGRKVGDLRMARCIEIPGALTSFAHYGFIASTGLEIPEHAGTVVPSRDVFDPSFHAQLQGPIDMPEAADESSFWSEPLEVDSVPMRAFYYAGSQHMTSRHGAYYADKETD